PGQVGDYPMEVQAMIKAYKEALETTLVRVRQKLAADFRIYTLELTEKASTPAEAFAIVKRHLQSLEKLPGGVPNDTLWALVDQLQALEKDMQADKYRQAKQKK
uniref:hypothetical protein n=1 Tax=uncultured Microscilla sp. TaxID=432653 RepID=UPI00261CF89C